MITENRQSAASRHARRPPKDAGKVDPSHISMLKMNNVGIALDIARKSRASSRQRIVDDYCIMRRHETISNPSST